LDIDKPFACAPLMRLVQKPPCLVQKPMYFVQYPVRLVKSHCVLYKRHRILYKSYRVLYKSRRVLHKSCCVLYGSRCVLYKSRCVLVSCIASVLLGPSEGVRATCVSYLGKPSKTKRKSGESVSARGDPVGKGDPHLFGSLENHGSGRRHDGVHLIMFLGISANQHRS
jgi:hypothetical protein